MRCEISFNYFSMWGSCRGQRDEISFRPLEFTFRIMEFSRFSQELHVKNPRLLKPALRCVRSVDQAYFEPLYLYINRRSNVSVIILLYPPRTSCLVGYTIFKLSVCMSPPPPPPPPVRYVLVSKRGWGQGGGAYYKHCILTFLVYFQSTPSPFPKLWGKGHGPGDWLYAAVWSPVPVHQPNQQASTGSYIVINQ